MSLPLRDCDTCGLPQLFDYISRNQYPFVETGHAPSPRQFVIINIQTTINQAMNKFFIFILCLCCALTVAQAMGENRLNDSDANVFGHVLDKKTGEHLPFINVLLKGTTIGTTTDNSGHYFLKNLPEGKFTLEYKALGYKTVSKEVTLKKGKTLEINVELEEDQIALDGVVVSANRAETSRRLAPTLVNVLDAKVFTTTNAVNLAQGLNFQPGVRVETNCQNCGFQQVRINGLDGPYTQILD